MTMTLLSLLGLAVGLVAGTLHFLTLRRGTALYLGGGSPARAIALQLARLALLTAVLAGLAWLGAAPLLAGALGVVAARHLVLRRGKEA